MRWSSRACCAELAWGAATATATDAPGTLRVDYFHTGGQDQSFAKAWQARIDPADPYVVRAPPPRQALVAVEEHGPPADKVDVLLIGDGYTAAERNAKFGPDARRMADAPFRHEPFASRRTDFNILGLCPPSAESGVARPSTGTQLRTPVGAACDAQAFYRSQLDCVMFTRDEVPFCRVCQRALEQVIDLYAGPRATH